MFEEYPQNNKYFQDFMDEPGISALSAMLCMRFAILPQGYVYRFNDRSGKHEWMLRAYFPDVHPTGGDTPLRFATKERSDDGGNRD